LRSALRGSGGKCARASGGLRASEQKYTFMQGRAQVLNTHQTKQALHA